MKHVKELVDLCVKKCSSEAELARRIGVHYQVINDMRHGRRAISPETVGLLCDVLELSGDEAREWLAISVIENPKNSSRAEVLRRAFFALWVAGVALGAVLPTESKAKSQAERVVSSQPGFDFAHILESLRRWLRGLVDSYSRRHAWQA